jgi:hypothetical protein
MARNDPVRYVSTFRAPSEYERQLEEARRRAMLAEALAQQQYEPQEGVVAPIPRAAPLVKALQGFMTARAGRQAKEAEEAAEGMKEDYAQRMLGRMEGGYVYKGYDPSKPPAPIPEQTELGEVTRQSQYVRSPQEALAMASTKLGADALKDRPIMAARLAKMLETPEAEEFYAPIETTEGLVQFGKRGGKQETGYAAPTKPATSSSLSKLIAERDALPPDSPLRATYDAAIEKATTNQPPIALNLGEKGDIEAQKIFLKDLGELRPKAYAARNIIRAVNNLDRLTEEGTYTGALAPTAVGASQFLNSIGIKIDPKILENTEAFAALSSDLVLSAQATLGGARGFTENETAILMQSFPQLINSPQARITIGNIIRDKQLDVIDEYDSLITDYESTYKDSKIPYKKMDDEEVRYQRWKRAQRNR